MTNPDPFREALCKKLFLDPTSSDELILMVIHEEMERIIHMEDMLGQINELAETALDG